MNQSIKLYYLYCMNRQCQKSIYHRMETIQIPFTAKNIVNTHVCTCCKQPLVSAIDIAIKEVVTEVNGKKYSTPFYLNN